jgi:PAS domain S-box-containing protein
MLTRIFPLPAFDDENLTRSAMQLRTVVLTMIGMSTLYIVAWTILVPEFSYRIIFALPLYPLFFWLLNLTRKGNVKLAGSLMVAGIWLVLFIAAAFSGGVLAPGYSGLLITVLAAGIFMSREWANKITLISVAGGGVLVFLERQGIMPPASQFTDATTMWIAQAVFFFIAASLLQMGTQRIASALQRAQHEIEQRRKTEGRLREAEKQYRELVERVPAVIYSAEPGPAGRWLYVSPGILSLSGFSAEEWMADPDLWYSRLNPEDREVFIAGEKQALKEGRQFNMEYRFRRKDGSIIWIRDESLYVTGNESGEQQIVQGYMLDITESKLTEEKLRASEVLLTTIIETIPFDFWVCDENDRYILQNPISKSLAGDLIGKTVDELDIPLPTRESYKQKHLRLLSGETLRIEEEYEKDGLKSHLLLIGAPIQDAETLRGFVGMTIDITEQKRTQEALREAELLYRTLVEQTSVVIYRDVAEDGGPSIFISPQIKDLIGYTAEEFSSNPLFWHSLIHPADKEAALKTVHETVTKEENNISEYRLQSKNGDWVWLRDEAVIVKNEQGKPLYVQGVYVDITKQKQVEAQRESLIKELEAKNTELERFTYTVSHDLKAPLITMGGFLGFLEQDALSGNSERLKADIQRISDANLKMQQLLNELLELSRIGRLINPPEDIPFEQIVRESLSRVESQLKQRQIEVRIGSGLPIVRGDRVRLVEVVQNLLDNAAKFMGDQEKPVIKVGATTENGDTVFFVRDNGIGIDPKYHAKVFELFNKLNPTAEGTGIGLALVKRIVEVHGGKIWIESAVGKGSTFYFTLPSL